MPTINLMDVPFQYKIFLIASLANLVVNFTNVVRASISFWVSLLAQESALLNQTISVQEDQIVADANAVANENEKRDLIGREPFGKVVGFLEVELYLYAMIANITSLITAVLLFKAFSGWLATNPGSAPEAKSMRSLARFYSYAIGNFVSLLWALVIFEILHWLMHSYPEINTLLTVL